MFQILERMMAPTDRLTIRCDACRHQVAWTQDETFRRLGSHRTPSNLKHGLVCGRCGEKTRLSTWL